MDLWQNFLSTLSLRRATERSQNWERDTRFFYPRSPCGERLSIHTAPARSHKFSIHALLAESDFLPFSDMLCIDFSIHALLAESDHCGHRNRQGTDFSIHALLAESDAQERFERLIEGIFLSTLSLRRATILGRRLRYRLQIFYPRSPCGERPHGALGLQAHQGLFYPRSPCGERPIACGRYCKRYFFYPRSPCGERRQQTHMQAGC